ncbi:MarR family winged helix-turn-helix transcriptional regulator [Listeria sp. PSOL-1]|uniref:MarR family winged helix-turn-helix transcriptional regulator n=1 Tax=Listeria sp. PSOL-1 TaxID=1844999 RepID=UPI0013D135FF|nr:MarR family transcriptional regulator [Listeria sp. PSOL-1]
MNFKRAELLGFHFEGYTRAEIRFLFILFHGLKKDKSKMGMKVSDIGQLLRVSKPSVTQQINALEKKGLINRTQNPEDKRAVYLTFTEKGNKLMKQVIKKIQANFEDMRDYIGEEDMKTLIYLLEKLTDYLNHKGKEEGGVVPNDETDETP